MSRARSALAVTLAAVVLAGCTGHGSVDDGDVVATYVPDEVVSRMTSGAVGWPYPEGARVVRVSVAGESSRDLSVGLFAAGAPDVAPDGRHVLFAGRASEAEPQGIWEILPGERAARRVYAGERDCGDPAYLAHGAVVFACETAAGDGGDPVKALFVLEAGAAQPERITWTLVDAFDPTPLADGRILFAMPTSAEGRSAGLALHTVNADGSLPEPFGDHHARGASGRRPRQEANGDIVVVRDAQAGAGAGIERIPFVSPVATTAVSLGREAGVEWVGSVEPDDDGLLVVAASGASADVFRVSPDGAPVPVADAVEGFTPVEAVPLRPTAAPRGRPRIVAASGGSGFLVGYDAGRTDGIVGPPQGSPVPHSVRLQIHRAGRARFLAAGIAAGPVDAATGVTLHTDRSFFLEVPADVPMRVATLDAQGRTIATSAWFWVRPGETRACFGCHAGHAAAPVNRPVAAIRQPPLRLLDAVEAIAGGAGPAVPAEAGQ